MALLCYVQNAHKEFENKQPIAAENNKYGIRKINSANQIGWKCGILIKKILFRIAS